MVVVRDALHLKHGHCVSLCRCVMHAIPVSESVAEVMVVLLLIFRPAHRRKIYGRDMKT